MKKLKKFFKILFLSSLVIAAGVTAYLLFWPMKDHKLFSLVPQDAVFIIESEDPVEDWKSFSDSRLWKHMKLNPSFADINAEADWIDSLIRGNETLLSLLGKSKLLISAHSIKDRQGKDSYDFMYLINLKRKALAAEPVLSALNGLGITGRKEAIEGRNFTAIDFDDGYTLYFGFYDNVFLCSYTKAIIQKAIRQYETPYFTKEAKNHFYKIRSQTPTDGNCRFYLNYASLESFLKVYMNPVTPTAKSIGEALTFTSLDAEILDHAAIFSGYTAVNEENPSLINALNKLDGSSLKVQKILPQETSFFLSINFDKFINFYAQLDADMRKDSLFYADYTKYKRLIEKQLKLQKAFKGEGINTFEDFMNSWIGSEISMGMMPVNQKGDKQAYLAVFHAPNITKARAALAYIAKRLRKKVISPIKFKVYTYKGYEINNMKMKALFMLFFKKLWNKFDKPHFTTIDNFVVFSNDTAALHRIIDHYESGQTLSRDPNYQKFASNFHSESSYFLYLNGEQIYPFLPTLGTLEAAKGIRKNRPFITCFKRVGFQLQQQKPFFQTKLYIDFDPK